jgi:hypothetical protein
MQHLTKARVLCNLFSEKFKNEENGILRARGFFGCESGFLCAK